MTKSREPRDELNDLLSGAVEVAASFLEEHGEFPPFGLALLGDGRTLQLEVDDDDDDIDTDALVESLRATLRERLDELRAFAIAADVTLRDDDDEPMTSAISIAMEHVNSDPLQCYVPYELNEAVELGDLVAEPGERHVFPASVVN